MTVIRVAATVGCALFVLSPMRGAAQAQESAAQYPSRAVTFVVPFAPGGVTSVFARLAGQKLEEKFGKPFVVENRPGGGGVTAPISRSQSTSALMRLSSPCCSSRFIH